MLSSKEILQKYWGYSSFRNNQEEVISSVVNKVDTLCIMPTGAGKSICYQVAALQSKGVCLVVEPLISLIDDQIDNLKRRGINAVKIYHSQSYDNKTAALNAILSHRAKFLFVAVERLTSKDFLNFITQVNLSMIVFDEAHCVSQWGHSFRPAYLKAGEFRQHFPDVPILALTGSATTEVKKDILTYLDFRIKKDTPYLFESSYLRNNIIIKFVECNDKLEKIAITYNHLKSSGIVYCKSRAMTQIVAEKLTNDYGIEALPYHAAMTMYERTQTQKKWISGQVPIVVATNAFGMGIDKADVRFVIHLDIPTSIEAYYQEFGRAGRDGNKSYSIVLYNKHDFKNQILRVENSYPDKDLIVQVYNKLCALGRIAFGSGLGEELQVNVNQISTQLKITLDECLKALSILENEGFIRMENLLKTVHKVRIAVSTEEFIDFVRDYEQYYYIADYLLRTDINIKYCLSNIDIDKIANWGRVSSQQAVKDLTYLAKYKLIEYHPVAKGDNILFTKDRPYHEKDLLSKEFYFLPQKTANIRAKKVRDLVLTKKCRWSFILSYFAEKQKDCGICDNCRKKEK